MAETYRAHPLRVQLRRTKGWRKPAGAIVVARPSMWGNPFMVGPIFSRGEAVELFRIGLEDPHDARIPPPARARLSAMLFRLEHGELRGLRLCCWCPLDQPCHADVLAEMANQMEANQ